MLNGVVVTVLASIIVIWVSFSMAGRDEARVSASTDLSRWYDLKRLADIEEMEEVRVKRDYVTVLGRGVQEQRGYRLKLRYKNRSGYEKRSEHYFYDESEQDENFLSRFIKGDQIYVWIGKRGDVYVPGEIVENKKVQSIFGADRVLMYSLGVAAIMGIITSLFLVVISPIWIIFNLPIILISSIIPQLYMYMTSLSSEVHRVDYVGVSAVNQYGLYIDKLEDGIRKYKLVEQTLPMVLLEQGVGYLGYKPGKIDVNVDYDGNIPVHIASEYRISDLVKEVHDKVKG